MGLTGWVGGVGNNEETAQTKDAGDQDAVQLLAYLDGVSGWVGGYYR